MTEFLLNVLAFAILVGPVWLYLESKKRKYERMDGE
jgi:hypothetical protein